MSEQKTFKEFYYELLQAPESSEVDVLASALRRLLVSKRHPVLVGFFRRHTARLGDAAAVLEQFGVKLLRKPRQDGTLFVYAQAIPPVRTDW